MSPRPRPRSLRRLPVVVAIAAFAWLSAPAAPPDDDPLEPPPLERYARWGPLRVRPGIAIRDVGYDSNVFNAADPVSDYLARLAPRADVLVLFGERAFLVLEEELQYTAYAKNSGLNYWDQYSKARLTAPFGDYGVFAEVQYDRVRQSPIDLDDIRPVYELFRVELGAVAHVGGRTTLEVGHSRGERRHFDDDFNQVDLSISEQLDRTETYDRLEVRYRAFGRTRLTLRLVDGDVAFDTPNIVGQPGFDRNVRERRIVPGVTLGTGGPLSGTVQVGWAGLDYRGERIDDFSGWVGDAEIAYRPTDRVTLTATAERDTGFSVVNGNNYTVYDTLELGGVYYLRRWLGLEIGADRGALRVPGTGRRDELERIYGGIRLRLADGSAGRRVEYRVRVGEARRTSNIQSLDRDRTFVRISAEYGF